MSLIFAIVTMITPSGNPDEQVRMSVLGLQIPGDYGGLVLQAGQRWDFGEIVDESAHSQLKE